MGNYDFDNSHDGDWEDRGDVSWNEFDWQQFLLRQQREVARFIATYDQHVQAPDRLDRVAQAMGWEREDWSVGDGFEEEDEDFAVRDEEEGTSDADPYTLHRHPVFVVTTGLYMQLRYLWENALAEFPRLVDAAQSWRIANALAHGERHGLLMIQAVDMGDFLLAVCHGKLAMRAVNDALRQIDPLESHSDESRLVADALRARLFDMREVCLRVMNDCREEDRRGFRDHD